MNLWGFYSILELMNRFASINDINTNSLHRNKFHSYLKFLTSSKEMKKEWFCYIMIPRTAALLLAIHLWLHKWLLVEQLHDLVFKINTTGMSSQKWGGNQTLWQCIYKHTLDRPQVASCFFSNSSAL
jgi:hypothetical protein